jgi:Rps23 Pro-64 3,4-dihydroxylase Tpa1-like proline 4-hydroxylase
MNTDPGGTMMWSRLAQSHRESYRSADPWPHLVLDSVFDPEQVRAAEQQEMQLAETLEGHRSYRQVKAESAVVAGPAAAGILADLASTEFVDFLQQLTGIDDLLTDPTHFWAGLHVGRPGSFQSLHLDFRRQPKTGLYHRVNVLVYLNDSWPESYGGHLELWRRDRKACARRITPLAGRMVIFETGPETYHGVPDPLTCPEDRARLVLVSYFYTEQPAPDDRRRPLLRRPRRPQDPWHLGIASPADASSSVRLLTQQVRRRRSPDSGRISES